MSGTSANTPEPSEGVPPGLLASLIALVKAVVYPFDHVLCGMVSAGLCVEALSRFLGLTRSAIFEHIVRLGLPTPADKVIRSAGARGWSDEDVRRLVAWRPVGVHPEVIGVSLSTPRKASAVRAKCRRIGLAAPARDLLFRPDPSELRRLSGVGSARDAQSPSEKCGRSAGPMFPGFDAGSEPEKARLARRERSSRLPVRAEGQRELGLMGIVAGTEHVRSSVLETPTLSARSTANEDKNPKEIKDLDFADLTWIGSLRSPSTNAAAVFAIGTLFMSALHYRVIATMTGKSAASLRTIRTRIGVPVDGDRRKFTDEFDIDSANATRVLGGWIVRKSYVKDGDRAKDNFFWVHSSDRGTKFSPTKRKRDHLIEGRSPRMTIITRAMIEEAAAKGEPIWPIPAPLAIAS